LIMSPVICAQAARQGARPSADRYVLGIIPHLSRRGLLLCGSFRKDLSGTEEMLVAERAHLLVQVAVQLPIVQTFDEGNNYSVIGVHTKEHRRCTPTVANDALTAVRSQVRVVALNQGSAKPDGSFKLTGDAVEFFDRGITRQR
jgi:hypothetical protein